MENLKPIPIPLKQRWHEFRVAYLPGLVFLGLLFLIGWLWRSYVQPSTIIGEVETVRANIISIVPGTLAELKVDRLQAVTNGQELAVIAVLDPDQLTAAIAAAEADLRLMKARMDIDKTRNVEVYSRLRTDLLVEQLTLELARTHLIQADSEFGRSQKLFDSQFIASGAGTARNDYGYDVALRDRNTWRAEVATREQTVAELLAGVQRLEASGTVKAGAADPAVEQAIAAQRARLQQLQKPIVLRSPMNGFISDLRNRTGEKVKDGATILVVSAGKSDRILAWVRQPVTERPQVGDTVEVRRGSFGQTTFEATVVVVGQQLEQINPTSDLLHEATARTEFGLPLIVKADETLELIPGEAVQLRIIRRIQAHAVN
jgi:multidrug resistance efflux pump